MTSERLWSELPDWIKPDIWSAFEEMRKRRRAPLTDQTRKGIVAALAKLREQGNEPNAVLNQSIAREWTGVFPLKSDGQREKPKQEVNFDATERYLREQKEREAASRAEWAAMTPEELAAWNAESRASARRLIEKCSKGNPHMESHYRELLEQIDQGAFDTKPVNSDARTTPAK